METLDRGLVVMLNPSGDGRLVSRRFFGTDDEETYFEVIRDGETIKKSTTDATCHLNGSGYAKSTYQVVAHYPDETTDTTEAVIPWSGVYYSLALDKPEGGTVKSSSYEYTPNDCSVGDIDGDGTLLYATGYGHGDAMRLCDLLSDRDGLEVFDVHESEDDYHGWDLHDAATGEIIHNGIIADSDNRRGLAADIDEDYRGFEFWSASDSQIRDAVSGSVISTSSTTVNFRSGLNPTNGIYIVRIHSSKGQFTRKMIKL